MPLIRWSPAAAAVLLLSLAAPGPGAAQTETGPGPRPVLPEKGPAQPDKGVPGAKADSGGVTKSGEQDCEAVWRSSDADRDDAIAGNELANHRGVLSQLDTNGDGRVDHDEFSVACGKGLLQGTVIR